VSAAPTVPATRIAASAGVLLALFVATVAVALAAVSAIGSRDEEIAVKTELLADLRARALPATRAGGVVHVPPEAAYLAGETEAIAGNRLQEQVTGAVEAAGGKPLSIGITGVEDGIGGSRRITVEIAFETGSDGLQETLFALEAGVPYVFVDGLVVQPQEAAGGGRSTAAGPLRATMSVSGYWRPATGSGAPAADAPDSSAAAPSAGAAGVGSGT
jgi:general secretion pathway protein M